MESSTIGCVGVCTIDIYTWYALCDLQMKARACVCVRQEVMGIISLHT